MINNVWDDHIIQPNAILGSLAIENIENAAKTATGYDPMPPLVAAILKLADINPIKMAANGIFVVSSKAKVVI